jgi:hypothetical protein
LALVQILAPTDISDGTGDCRKDKTNVNSKFGEMCMKATTVYCFQRGTLENYSVSQTSRNPKLNAMFIFVLDYNYILRL